MMFKRMLLLAAASASAICLGVFAGPSAANAGLNFGDVCAAVTPSQTIGIPGSATSYGAAWFTSPNGLCYRYVVDVGVPAGSMYGVLTRVDNSLTPATCPTLTEDVTVYWKSALATAFTRVANGHFNGSWVNGILGGCQLNQTSGDATLFGGLNTIGYSGTTNSSPLGAGILRVAVAAHTSEGPRMLTVTSQFNEIPN
jgi:hypothetical protein